MDFESFIAATRSQFKRWFHERKIIVISEHKVKQIPVSVRAQCAVLTVVATCICLASYSTGSFIVARSTLKEQNQALRSVASARIENSFGSLLQPTTHLHADASVTNDPMFTLSALDQNRLVNRIATLEKQVTDLQTANNNIIERVREKTAGSIDNLESIIKYTGLSPEDLKKQLAGKGKNKTADKDDEASGGPFIPADSMDNEEGEREVFSNLDEVALLRRIVGNLPLGVPVKDAEEHSPFGRRIDPLNGRLAFHSGIDLSGPAGSNIMSTADGTVTFAGRNGAYGNMVDIDHGFGLTTRYAHLSEVLVDVGQKVARGETIGIQGSTGRSTGAHVHYEVRYHDQPMNPKNFLEAVRHVSQNENE